jgi:hypothetical protein
MSEEIKLYPKTGLESVRLLPAYPKNSRSISQNTPSSLAVAISIESVIRTLLPN